MEAPENDKTAQEAEDEKPVRRKDLVALGDTFKSALGPVAVVVEHMKVANTRSAELANKMQSHTSRLQSVRAWLVVVSAGTLVGVLAIFYSLWTILDIVDRNADLLSKMEQVAASADEAQRTAEAVSDVQQSRGRVELIPEMDPVKAVDAPVRVRITAPEPKEDASSAPDTVALMPSPPMLQRPVTSSGPQKPPAQKKRKASRRSVEIPISRKALQSLE